MNYQKLDPTSAEALPSGMDLFSTPLTQVAIERTYEREFLTMNPRSDTPYTFRILTGTGFMVPNRTRIVTSWVLRKKDWDAGANKFKTEDFVDVEAADKLVPINGLGATFIRDMKVQLQGQLIFDANNLYSQYAYIENLMNFPEESKKSSMSSYGWYHEDTGKSAQFKDPPPDGWKKRRDLFLNGQEVEFSAPLYADFFQQPLFLLNNMHLEIVIQPQTANYLVVAPEKYKGAVELELTQIKMYATFVDLHPGVALELEKKLEHEPARYFMNRITLRSQFVEPVRNEATFAAFTDYIPDEMTVFAMLKQNYQGQLDRDPTFLGHFDMRNFSVLAGNMEIPHVAFELDIEKGKYMRAYEHMHRTLGTFRSVFRSVFIRFEASFSHFSPFLSYFLWIYKTFF